MAKNIIFTDEYGNYQLEAYINEKAELYIGIEATDNNGYEYCCLSLKRDEAIELVEYLQSIIDELL